MGAKKPRLNLIPLAPSIVLALGLSVTYVLQHAAREAAYNAVRDDFGQRTTDFVQYMDRRLHSYEQVLEGAAGLFAASREVARSEFATYVTTMKVEGKYPGIQGVGFSLAVLPRDRARHVARIRAEGFTHYDIKPPGERELYTSIIYLEPFDWRNRRAFGFDMYSEPVRREAMARARDEDAATVSGRVRLVQETEQDVQQGFLMYVPVYRANTPRETPAQRADALVGWVYAPFRMNDLMDALLGNWTRETSAYLNLEIYDGDAADPNALMFHSDAGQPHPERGPLFRVARPLSVFGHRWTVVADSMPAFDARLSYEKANIIVAAGVSGSALLALIVWLLATGGARAQALAESMTEELRRSEAWQRELNRALRLLSDCNTALVRAEDEFGLLSEICRLCVERGGYVMAWVGYAEHDDARTVRPVAKSGHEEGYLDDVRIVWADDAHGQGPTGTAIRTGRTSVNADVLANPRTVIWREAAVSRGYRSSIGLPLVTPDGLLGALTLYAPEPDAFDADEVRLLEELAGDLAYGIAALRTRAGHRHAEEEIRRLNQGLERRVAERTAQLEAANKELEAFAYSVSHDLRAPLRHIDGFAHMLKDEAEAQLGDSARHYLDVIVGAARRMEALIEDLLAFSRMSRSEMSRTAVDLGELVRDVLQELEPEQRGRQVDWRIGALPEVTGDRAMLRVVLVNLMSNALKFTRLRAPATIEIGTRPGEGETVFFVRDNGAGFDMSYVDKLFGVFQRLHRDEEFEGTGIGLANVRRIVARHGGRTWAEGAVDRGATFYFSLPANTPDAR